MKTQRYSVIVQEFTMEELLIKAGLPYHEYSEIKINIKTSMDMLGGTAWPKDMVINIKTKYPTEDLPPLYSGGNAAQS